MSSTGTLDLRSSGLRTPVSTTVHSRRGADQEAADLLERALRRRQPDALRPAGPLVLEPLERQREVGAALGRATAWISSTITASTPRRISRACEVSIR